jgi:phosphohistidine phosphatase SixA
VKEILQLKVKEVACFGHGPHVDLLVAHLAGAHSAFTELKKPGVACFEHPSAHSKWMLRWLVTPKMLRELRD